MSELRSGGREDRQGVVGPPPKRDPVAGQARRSAAGAASAAQKAEDDALLAQVTANDAMFEAEFGSVAVGRLVAGTLAVGQYIQSQGYSAGSSGWRINADGTAELNNVTVRGDLIAAASSNNYVSILQDDPTINSPVVIWRQNSFTAVAAWVAGNDHDSRPRLTLGSPDTGLSASLIGWNITAQDDLSGTRVFDGGNRVAVKGDYSTGDILSWGGVPAQNGTTSSTEGHTHSVPYHVHEVTI